MFDLTETAGRVPLTWFADRRTQVTRFPHAVGPIPPMTLIPPWTASNLPLISFFAIRTSQMRRSRLKFTPPAVLVTGSENPAADRLRLSHSTAKHHLPNARSRAGATTTAQLAWILSHRLPQPEGVAQTDE